MTLANFRHIVYNTDVADPGCAALWVTEHGSVQVLGDE